jgi:hypothetical protein
LKYSAKGVYYQQKSNAFFIGFLANSDQIAINMGSALFFVTPVMIAIYMPHNS